MVAALVPEAGTTSGSSAAEQAVGENAGRERAGEGECNAATVAFVALLLVNSFLSKLHLACSY